MAESKYTIHVTSNKSTEIKSWTVSTAWVKVGAWFSAFFVVLSGLFVFDYFKTLNRLTEENQLQYENSVLRQKFKLLEAKLQTLESSVQRVQSFSGKVNNVIQKNAKYPQLKLLEKNPALSKKLKTSFGSFLSQSNPNKLMKQQPVETSTLSSLTPTIGLDNLNDVVLKVDEAILSSENQESDIMAVWDQLSQKKSLLNAIPSGMPVKTGWLTSRFGYRRDPFTGDRVRHMGLDFGAAPGTPVYAPARGVVSYVGYESGYGNLLTIDHGYGIKTRYAHNSKILVKYKQKIEKGQQIAEVGSTGRSSGSHLHYEVRLNNLPVDPLDFVKENE